MANHHDHANLIWQIADLLRGPYRPPQYESVMLPMTVLRRFDCVLAPTKAKVLAEYEKRKGGKLEGDALDTTLNGASGQRFHNHSPLDFQKLKGDPDNIEKHLVSYIKGFSKWFTAHPALAEILDRKGEGDAPPLLISQHEDKLQSVEHGTVTPPSPRGTSTSSRPSSGATPTRSPRF